MRPYIRLAAASLAALVLSACTDNAQRLLAPKSPDALYIPPGGGSGGWKIDPFANLLMEISAGYKHTCVRQKNGVMYCWGTNSSGEIGIPSTGSCGTYGYGIYPCVPAPKRVTGSAVINGVTTAFNGGSSIRAGGAHTCALAAGGVAWCWGTNWYGEIGNGAGGTSYDNVLTPTPVNGGLAFSAIDGGGFTTCGLSAGWLYCWGNSLGGMAVGTKSPKLISWWGGWGSSIRVGDGHACAQAATGWWGCFGSNTRGQIGLDPTIWYTFDGIVTPTSAQNTGLVEMGGPSSCADQPDGTVHCWGDNQVGQLGNSSVTDSRSFNPVVVGGGMQLHGVTVGGRHACALDPNGAAFCWGANNTGQVGNGSMGPNVLDPSPVAPFAGTTLTFSALAAGAEHTCGIGTDNYIYCWGDNYQGQLGQPAAPQHGQTTPVRTVNPS
jgi:alpha-tubulin suppressor-like RCC1 family protein